ncbi:hypothetical protein B0T25DRAFT_334943 [Lasiosphaeria hispida]|uniref:DUF7514 domain-containing protein n=1 Tax=Lasiosphaeria hispida TaxID=260671 RepID=A0AAJ0H620_9PEZI|nr:hypothetical protein B0T25DRAFT_334943 [Lasiosphaeria hispida]
MAAQPPPPTPPPGDAKDGKAFYGYLFVKQNTIPDPTPVLKALLTALACHIKNEIGDKNEKHLKPGKLAAFYKDAGYDYDTLFADMSAESISFVYQVQGCQHYLLPTDNDFIAPSIPALTVKGFVRWQAIQILLEPQIHVPVIQFAVRNWALKNPDDGTPFPPDLPKEAFPQEPDPDTDLWYQSCAVRLREEATPKEDVRPNFADEHPEPTARGVPVFVHVGATSSHDYFNRPRTGATGKFSYVRVPEDIPRSAPVGRSPERRDRDARECERAENLREHYTRRPSASSEDRQHRRRRSFTDHPPVAEERPAHVPHIVPEPRSAPRRASHPHYETSSETDDGPMSPRAEARSRSRPHRSTDPPPISVRRVYGPEGARIHSTHPVFSSAPHIPSPVPEEVRRTSHPEEPKTSLFDNVRRLSKFLPGGGGSSERQRTDSRGRKGEHIVHTSGSRESTVQGSRLSRSFSDYNENESDSEDQVRHRRVRREKDQDRDKIRDRDRDRIMERERPRSRDIRDREKEREKAMARERSRYKDHDRDSDERRRDRDRDRDRIVSDRSHRRSREPSDEDSSPLTRTRGSGGSGGSGPYLMRPDVGQRRTSSHADIDRRRDRERGREWDVRERERLRDERWRREENDRERSFIGRDRDREPGSRDRTRTRNRDKDRDRERERERERGSRERDRSGRLPSPVVTGVTGRKYPDVEW